MDFWQGIDKCKDGTLKYQNENVNKPGRKRKLSLLEEFLVGLVRLKTGMFLLDLSERFDVSVSLILKTFTTWINFLYQFFVAIIFPFSFTKISEKVFTKKF